MTGLEEPTPRGDLPDAFFVFVNSANPMTEQNYRVTKTFSSRFAGRLHLLDTGQADPMPFTRNPDVDPMPTPFVLSVTSEYEVEWNAELGSKAFAPQAPSRMSALYAFGGIESCLAVHVKYGWPLKFVRPVRTRRVCGGSSRPGQYGGQFPVSRRQSARALAARRASRYLVALLGWTRRIEPAGPGHRGQPSDQTTLHISRTMGALSSMAARNSKP